MQTIRSSEITPQHVYASRPRGLSRRRFMVGLGALAGVAALSACGPKRSATPASGSNPGPGKLNATTDELGDPVNAFEQITNYNNYYEFTTDKEGVAQLSAGFKTEPWTVQIGGLVDTPKTYSIDDLRKKFSQEERVYRHRCVEGWSMVIPWTGFPLAALLKEAGPTSQAKFVRFESVYAPDQMPGQAEGFYPWPYTEGLRLDEAMNDLALLVTGMYGQTLLPQNGAPFRLATPWKYGFKSIKAIVKIDLVTEQPATLWNTIASNEYGFYSNVNPDVPHPRWSQSTERRIGELGRRPTLMFNGYADQVAGLYTGMDLRVNY